MAPSPTTNIQDSSPSNGSYTPLERSDVCSEARLRMERFLAGSTTMSAYERLPLTSGSQGGNYPS